MSCDCQEIDELDVPLDNPSMKYLRRDRMPHIWCPGCGIGTTLNSFAHALDEARPNLSKIAQFGEILSAKSPSSTSSRRGEFLCVSGWFPWAPDTSDSVLSSSPSPQAMRIPLPRRGGQRSWSGWF